jgi:hypothetical protein
VGHIEKTCAHCGGSFVVELRYRRARYCGNSCYQKAWRQENPRKAAAYTEKWRGKNPEKTRESHRKRDPRAYQNSQLKYRYGLTLEVFEAGIIHRLNLCEVCGSPNQMDPYLVVDHCHDSGAVRGFLCGGCNSALGYAKDNPTTLRALADYLERAAELQRLAPLIDISIPPPNKPPPTKWTRANRPPE